MYVCIWECVTSINGTQFLFLLSLPLVLFLFCLFIFYLLLLLLNSFIEHVSIDHKMRINNKKKMKRREKKHKTVKWYQHHSTLSIIATATTAAETPNNKNHINKLRILDIYFNWTQHQQQQQNKTMWVRIWEFEIQSNGDSDGERKNAEQINKNLQASITTFFCIRERRKIHHRKLDNCVCLLP